MNKLINKQDVIDLLKILNKDTKVFFGCDSIRFKNKGLWFAEYTTVLVVHKNGFQGCKIFSETNKERDYDNIASRPFNRMLNEAKYVCELYLRFEDIIYEYELEHEIHLDISKDINHGSNVAIKAASGYVMGMTNIIPMCKPDAPIASYAADRGKRLAN